MLFYSFLKIASLPGGLFPRYFNPNNLYLLLQNSYKAFVGKPEGKRLLGKPRCIVGFKVLTAVVVKTSNFWVITQCRSLKVNRCFGGTCRSPCYQLHAGFLLGLYINSEDVGNMFLRNVGWLSTDRTALYPRR
jgi:hypothetical protein